MDELADRFGPDLHSVFVYTREAHPGERHGHHETFEDKLASARLLIERFGVRRPVLVDDLAGSTHRAYGLLPNMTYVLRRGGRVHYRSSWTDTLTIEPAIAGLVAEARSREQGQVPLPYYIEWEPARARDRIAFMEGLRDGGGARAVEEYLAAAGKAYGRQYTAPLEAWWESQRPDPHEPAP